MTSSTHMVPFAPSPELRTALERISTPAIVVGVLLSALSIFGAFVSPGDFFRSYLMSYLFWFGLTLGSMAVVMLQYLTGGAWGVMIRRALESATRTLPLALCCFYRSHSQHHSSTIGPISIWFIKNTFLVIGVPI